MRAFFWKWYYIIFPETHAVTPEELLTQEEEDGYGC